MQAFLSRGYGTLWDEIRQQHLYSRRLRRPDLRSQQEMCITHTPHPLGTITFATPHSNIP